MLVHASRARTRVEVEHVHVEAAVQRRRLRGKPQLMRPYAICWRPSPIKYARAGLVTLHGRQRGRASSGVMVMRLRGLRSFTEAGQSPK